MTIQEIISSFVDVLVQPRHSKVEVDRSKVVAMLSVWMASTTVMWLYVLFCRLTFGHHVVTYGGLISTIVHSSAPLFFYIFRSIPGTGLVISFSGLSFQVIFCLYSGGMESPAAIWLALHPVLLAFFASIPIIVFSVIINALVVLVLTVLKFYSLLPLDAFPSVYKNIMSVSSYIGLDILIAVFTVATMKVNLKASGVIQAKREMIENLVRILSHDICNPLTVASAQTFKLRKKDLPIDKEISKLEKSHDQILQIVESVRYWMAAQGNKMMLKQEFLPHNEIRDHLEHTFSDRFLKKNIIFSFANDLPEPIVIVGDRSAILFQIFNNIVSNAIKFTPEGKSIDISAYQDDKTYTYKITDSGQGITDSLREKVFSTDSATSHKGTNNEVGTGFGMPIVKVLMEKMGGAVEINNEMVNGEVSGAVVTLSFLRTTEDESKPSGDHLIKPFS